MSPQSIYNTVRVVGYASGLTGLTLWFLSRSGQGKPGYAVAGAIFMLIMFLCLTGAYVVVMLRPRNRLSPRSRPPPREDPDTPESGPKT